MISTVHNDQHDILINIAALYCDNKFDLDPTYSTGGFYKNGVPVPNLKYDINPVLPEVQQADCRDLPINSASLESIVFDPPFLHATGKDSLMGQRFSDARSQHSLRGLYFAAMIEFYRILKPGGVLVFKCQDIIESGKQVMNHCHIWQLAHNLGFIDLDLFILLKRSSMTGHNWSNQKHAHRGHSYFWVFQKGTRG